MNEHSASRIARESFDKTLETGTETVRGVQEGFASALDNVRDLNIRLIGMARANTNAAFDFASCRWPRASMLTFTLPATITKQVPPRLPSVKMIVFL